MRSKNRPDCFLVYRSASHTYLRLFLLGFPWLCVVLAEYTGFSPFYAVAACMFLVCYPFLVVMCAVLKLDSLGVHLLRPFKSLHIAWEDVRFTGCLTIRYMGSAAPANLRYFSTKPVAASVTGQPHLPQPTGEFLFAMAQPGLEEAIARYHKESFQKM